MHENGPVDLSGMTARAGGRIIALEGLYASVVAYASQAKLAEHNGTMADWQAEALRSAWYRIWEAMRDVELAGPMLPGEPGTVLSPEQEANLEISLHGALKGDPIWTLIKRFTAWVLTHGKVSNLTEEDVFNAMWPLLILMAKAVAAHEHDRQIASLRDPEVAAASVLGVKTTMKIEAEVIRAAPPEPEPEPEIPPSSSLQGSIFAGWGKGGT